MKIQVVGKEFGNYSIDGKTVITRRLHCTGRFPISSEGVVYEGIKALLVSLPDEALFKKIEVNKWYDADFDNKGKLIALDSIED